MKLHEFFRMNRKGCKLRIYTSFLFWAITFSITPVLPDGGSAESVLLHLNSAVAGMSACIAFSFLGPFGAFPLVLTHLVDNFPNMERGRKGLTSFFYLSD